MPTCLFAWSLCFWVYPATLGPREMNRAIRAESRVHGHDKPPGRGWTLRSTSPFILYDDNQLRSFLISPTTPDVVAHNPAAACPHGLGRYVQGLCPRLDGLWGRLWVVFGTTFCCSQLLFYSCFCRSELDL